MDINRMRLGLMYIFSESKNLKKQTKLQIVSFIESATESQLKALALDGEIIPKQLDKGTIAILDDRFKNDEDIQRSLKKASILAFKSIAK